MNDRSAQPEENRKNRPGGIAVRRVSRLMLTVAIALGAAACTTVTPPAAPPPSTAHPTSDATISSTATRVPSRVEPGAVLLTVGTEAVYGTVGYFATLSPNAGRGVGLAVYDSGSGELLSPPSAQLPTDPDCRIALVNQDGKPLALGMEQTSTAPTGLTPGVVIQHVVGLDPRDMRRLWTAEVSSVPNTDTFSVTGNSCAVAGDIVYDFESTSDGGYGLVTYGSSPVVIDLRTGRTTPMPGALTVLGK